MPLTADRPAHTCRRPLHAEPVAPVSGRPAAAWRMYLLAAIACLLIGLLAAAARTDAIAAGTTEPRLDGPASWQTLVAEDFDDLAEFPPSGWSSLSDDPSFGWGDSDCRPRSGDASAWSHAGGDLGGFVDCGTTYPSNVNHWLVYGPFSLAGATAAELSFAYWIETESEIDRFQWLFSKDGETFQGWYVSGAGESWFTRTVDLAGIPTLGSLLGSEEVWFAFVLTSDDSLEYEGVYVDDVVLRADFGSAAPTTPPPGASATPRPATPGTRPSATTAPPTGPSTVYLPHVRRVFPGHKDPRQESVAGVQQAIAPSEFEAEARRDPDLGSALDLAEATTGTRDLQWAGKLGDDEGVQMVFAELATGGADPPVVVRHCAYGICASALQTYLPGRTGLRWTTADGEVPVRTARMPLQLRLIDERDPDGSAVIAPTGDGRLLTGAFPALAFAGLPTGGRGVGSEEAADRERPAAPQSPSQNRRIRIASAFGKYLTLQGPNIDDLASSMRSGGFPDAQTIYHVNESEVDSNLATLGPSDAFVWLTHGDLSASKGKVVGMTVARAGWGSKHYPSSRMTQQLTKNTSGGPGIVILAGCQTADLIPVFDNGQRVVLAFNNKVMPGAASKAVKAFFNQLSRGGTMQEALDAANAAIADPKVRLVANPGANLGQRLVDLGTPNSCSQHFAAGWQGTLTVTRGSPRLPEGTTARYDCGRFTLAQGAGQNGYCRGCWVSGTFAGRKIAGCAGGASATLGHTDGGTEFTMAVDLIDQSTMRITNWSKDSQGADITRTGVFSRCP